MSRIYMPEVPYHGAMEARATPSNGGTERASIASWALFNQLPSSVDGAVAG
eukprot:COSAG02_NODE_50814_length_318_cov_0.707763_1_plen_50_part_01